MPVFTPSFECRPLPAKWCVGAAWFGCVMPADLVTRAELPGAEFDALAQKLLALGFFEMAAVYEEAGLQDGSWSTLTVQRSGSVHQVFRREDAGPPALKLLETAVTALQSRLAFVADTR